MSLRYAKGPLPPSKIFKASNGAIEADEGKIEETAAGLEAVMIDTLRPAIDSVACKAEPDDPPPNGVADTPIVLGGNEDVPLATPANITIPPVHTDVSEKLWHVEEAGAIAWLDSLPADGADLLFASPPYEAARTYGIDFNLRGQAWVDWMVRIIKAALRPCRGLVAFVLQGQVRNFQWSATPALLMADLHRAGVCLRNPPIFHRVGIPGSGGPDWLRSDYEWIVCASRGGKLPWADPTAMGHPPKWQPGGKPSHRCTDGQRVNARPRTGPDEGERQPYKPPKLANPGNIVHCNVGGGLIGSKLAHENEAPFPEALAEFFVRSFCPSGGLVLDCFSGSGTTGAVAIRHGRRFAGCDIRASQVELSRRRIAEVIVAQANGSELPPSP
jgi:hypothetical protein